MKSKRAKTQSMLADTVPNPGPGLFLDERARNSTARAYCAIRCFLQEEARREFGITWSDARPRVMPTLREIIRWYWANRDYDNRTTFVDMKPELKRLQKRLLRLQTAMDKLPRPVVHALNMQMSHRLRGGQVVVDHFADVRGANASLAQACAPILNRKNDRFRVLSVEKACLALWDLWEAVSGRPFVRQWEIGTTAARLVTTRGASEFIGRDALFVQIVLQAVDPKVKIQALRTGLKDVAANRPKSR